MVMYIDANIFILAILDRGIKGDRARSFIQEVRLNKREAFTSSLTYDEVVWVVRGEQGREFALKAGKVFLNLRNLVLLEANREIVSLAQSLMEKGSLDPRDAIHAVTAMRNKISTILSEDRAFDKVSELKRVSLAQL
ncbi:MAG TPA: type II toxin-antitoxin system VapC family toxin [Candidatus Nanoarchaeia archaeon]|nr:type II toxin-antitoxin system VapC family toxin [Candidatus Nanoarchaeia archaeon]